MMTIKMEILNLTRYSYRILVTALTINLLVFSGMAQSATVFSQTPLADGNGPASFFQEQSADNFLLAADTQITGIQWWGSFINDSFSNNSFDVRFFNNAAGLPTNSGAFEQFSVSASRISSGLFDAFGADVFLFEATLSSFDLLENTAYYVSIVHPDDQTDDEFYWLQSDETNSNFQRNLGGWSESSTSDPTAHGNLAFSLQGTQAATVPEPNSIVLIVFAFLAFSLYRRSIKL